MYFSWKNSMYFIILVIMSMRYPFHNFVIPERENKILATVTMLKNYSLSKYKIIKFQILAGIHERMTLDELDLQLCWKRTVQHVHCVHLGFESTCRDIYLHVPNRTNSYVGRKLKIPKFRKTSMIIHVEHIYT